MSSRTSVEEKRQKEENTCRTSAVELFGGLSAFKYNYVKYEKYAEIYHCCLLFFPGISLPPFHFTLRDI